MHHDLMSQERPFIIPIFLPHAGCPHQCVFCNQAAITGIKQKDQILKDVGKGIREFLSYKTDQKRPVQISFYGGNFLGLEKEKIVVLLKEANSFVMAGEVDNIRFSTRPDTIDTERLDLIKDFPVSTIELGVQSMDDYVLSESRRGHTSTDTEDAVKHLKKRNYEIGVQMMIGLPGDDDNKAIQTAVSLTALCPDFVRIYPTVVLKGSPLSVWYKRGDYSPLPLDDCVSLAKNIHGIFAKKGIPVIRMGLQASEDLDNGASIVAGPYHPAFGHMVLSEIFLDKAVDILKNEKIFSDDITITVNPRSISKMRGLNNRNIQFLKERFSISSINIDGDASLGEEELAIT